MNSTDSIGVIGAGTMGTGIAQICAMAGFRSHRVLDDRALVAGVGIASARDIDEAMKLGCKHPTGPLALRDLIGIDVVLAVMEAFHRDLKDPKCRPAPLLKEMVAAGHLGRKSGRGFSTYG